MRFDTMNKSDLVKLIIEQEMFISSLQDDKKELKDKLKEANNALNSMKNKPTISKNNESNSNQLNVNSLVINCTANNHNDIIKSNKYINIKDVNFNPTNKKSVETSL